MTEETQAGGFDRSELGALGSGDPGFGEKTQNYNPGLLETFENKHPGSPHWVQLVCGEFTSLCPKTGQPDWAEITITYIPTERCVESKSLKLYLGSFRNHGDFHEDVVNIIANDLVKVMSPLYLEVFGRFNPRGGIAIYPYAIRAADDPYARELADHRIKNFNPMLVKGPVLR